MYAIMKRHSAIEDYTYMSVEVSVNKRGCLSRIRFHENAIKT